MDIVTQGDSIYDIVDEQDHAILRFNLNKPVLTHNGHNGHSSTEPVPTITCARRTDPFIPVGDAEPPAVDAAAAAECDKEKMRENRVFLCRMNVARSFRRQSTFSEHKVAYT